MPSIKNIAVAILAIATLSQVIAASIPAQQKPVPNITHLVSYQDDLGITENIDLIEAGEHYLVLSNRSQQPLAITIEDIDQNQVLIDLNLRPSQSHIAYIKTRAAGARIKHSHSLTTWQNFTKL